MVGRLMTSLAIIVLALRFLVDSGGVARKKGICFMRNARSYSDGLSKFQTALAVIIPIIIGIKMLIEEVVSSMITTSEYVSLQ